MTLLFLLVLQPLPFLLGTLPGYEETVGTTLEESNLFSMSGSLALVLLFFETRRTGRERISCIQHNDIIHSFCFY